MCFTSSYFSLMPVHVRSNSQRHSFPGFRRGWYTLVHSVQSADKVVLDIRFASVSIPIHLSDREIGSMFVTVLLQPWLSTCDTGATPPGSSLFHLCWQILHLCMLQLFLLWNGHLCTYLSLWSRLWSEYRAQSFLLERIYFVPGLPVGFASWARFLCRVWGTFSQKLWQ